MSGKVFVSLMVLAAMLLTGQAFESMENVKEAAKREMIAIENGKDKGRTIISSKQLVLFSNDIKENIANMDDNVKIMMATFLKKTANAKSYTEALESMRQNPVMEDNTDLSIKRKDEFIPAVENFWKFKGNPSTHVVKTVKKWFTKLIGDEQVIEEINLTEGDIGYLVKSVASILKSLKSECDSTEENILEREVIALPVVRFPAIGDDNIVIYNVGVAAWVQCKSGSMIKDAIDSFKKKHERGLTGSFLTAAFTPRTSVIDEISDAVKEKAINAVVERYSD